jgi:Autophagy protein Atg8 ubiquitin like
VQLAQLSPVNAILKRVPDRSICCTCSVAEANFVLAVYSYFTEKRKSEAERIRAKYPDRIPVSVEINCCLICHVQLIDADLSIDCLMLASHHQVICEKADRSDIPDIDKKKYLVSDTASFMLHSQINREIDSHYCH